MSQSHYRLTAPAEVPPTARPASRRSSIRVAEGVRAPAIVAEVLRSPGQPLDDYTRAAVQPVFRHDFSQVRIHSDDRAALSARAIGATAYTAGSHIALDAGRHRPGTPQWVRLVAHELTHVVQQRGLDHQQALVLGDRGDASEREADSVASSLVSGRAPAYRPTISSSSASAIRRQAVGHANVAAPAQPGVTQQMYDDAVTLIASRDPKMAGFLRKAHVSHTAGAADPVRVERHPLANTGPARPTEVMYVFELEVVDSGTAPGGAADYAIRDELSQDKETTRLVVKLMTITLKAPAPGPDAVASLADRLFHEGLHMMLDMDRMMARLEPGNAQMQTGALAQEQGFESRAQANPGYPALVASVAGIVSKYPQAANATEPAGTSATPAQNRAAAVRVISSVIDERFAVGQAGTKMGGRESWSTAGTIDYLRHYLYQEVALPPANPPSFQEAVTKLDALLNALWSAVPGAGSGAQTGKPAPSPGPATP
jgi:hypothetical protein